MSAPAGTEPATGAALASELRAALREVGARVQAFERERAGAAETVRAYDRLLEPLNGLEGRARLYAQVHPDAELRASCEELERELGLLRTDLGLNRAVYERLAAADAALLATPAERRLLELALRDFRRSGVDRAEPVRARIRALQQEIVEIGQAFDRNILLGGRDFVVPGGHAALRGLPPDFLAAHPERADGSVLLTTDPPDRVPVLSWADDGELRRGYFLAVTNRAAPENLEVLARLLAARHELARLLGHAHWADHATEDKMTRSAGTARAFLERLVELVRARALVECEELLAEKRRVEPAARELYEWERAYWTERVKRRKLDFDSRSLRAYFPLEAVVRGVLETSARLFGVAFERASDAPTWHPSVEAYDLVEGGEVRARIYLDLHPRQGKFKHAALFPLADGVAGRSRPEAALVTNLPQPRPGDPALLLHDQVRTLFHEFGHLLHHCLGGRGAFFAFAGLATEHDFVEVPSQLFEEWAWSPEVLGSFARHAETGAPLPPALIERLRAAEEYGKGLHVLQQAFLADLSLAYHERDPAGLDPLREYVARKRALVPLPHEEGNSFPASFGHLHGYSALYYTYLWSLVIAKDCLERFEGRLLDPSLVRAYRESVLAPGGSRPADELVAAFLGRPFRFDAFGRWLAA